MNRDKGKDIGLRLAAMVLDHFIMTFATTIAAFIVLLFVFAILKFAFGFQFDEDIFPVIIAVLPLIIFPLYLNKDAVGGRSPAKRILKLMIVSKRTGKAAHPVLTVIRNFTLFLWPIEVIIVLISPSRRLGDIIAGTEVVGYDPQYSRKSSFLELLLSFVLAVILFVPIIWLVLKLNGFSVGGF